VTFVVPVYQKEIIWNLRQRVLTIAIYRVAATGQAVLVTVYSDVQKCCLAQLTLIVLNPRARLDIVDFGCADGAMLEAIATHIPGRFGSGLGLDVFRSGIPQKNDSLRI